MVLGIVALLSALFCMVGLIVGGVAVVLGYVAKRDIDRSMGAKTGSGMAMAGIVTGIIAASVQGVLILMYIVLMFSAGVFAF
jgi:hypothetical protein